MGSAKRTNQGGSILVYVIIGAILAAAVVGTVFLVRHRSEQAQRQVPAFTTPSAAPQPQTQSNSSDNSKTSTDANQGKQAPTATPAAPTTPAPTQSDQTAQATLPHTGPVETISSFVALALLTGTTIAYLRSRQSFAFQRS